MVLSITGVRHRIASRLDASLHVGGGVRPGEEAEGARVVQLPAGAGQHAGSGGYSQTKACRLLAENHALSASFSRALLEGLTAQQSDADFNTMLTASIERIYVASTT